MKRPILFTLLSVLICLSCDAQSIRLLIKGQPVPFDSAGVIDLPTYRTIRTKLTIGDQLVKGLRKENDSLRAEIKLADTIISKQNTLEKKQDQFAAENRIAFNELNKTFDKLLTEADKPKKWYQKPVTWVIVSAVGGFILGRQ